MNQQKAWGHRTTGIGGGPRLYGHVRGVRPHRMTTSPSRTIQEAIDQGINLIDTGDFYGMGHNEMLIGRAIQGRRDKVLLSVKFGAMRTPEGLPSSGFDGRPAAVKNFLSYSLRRLGVDYIDIYRPARLDATVPIEDTVGAIARTREGRIRPAYRSF